ncbi:hypothetical protein COCSADRAFT_103912, partial [Bipolaris sorokiniana ND90Pr]
AGSSYSNRESALKRVREERRCGRYKETGYNARTYKVDIISTSNSDRSKR